MLLFKPAPPYINASLYVRLYWGWAFLFKIGIREMGKRIFYILKTEMPKNRVY